MLAHVPRAMPPLRTILDDLGDPPATALARAMGVSRRTAERWRSTDRAPRVALLALFWLTRWGRSAVEARAVNDAATWHGMAECLKRENAALRVQLAEAEAMTVDEAANAPALLPGQLAAVRRARWV